MTKKPDTPTKNEELSFDQALEQLEKLASKLEEGDIPLEDALEVYERAVGLFSLCRNRLDTMEQRIEQLSEDLDGTLHTAPLETRAEELEDG